jgi:hypothetical protein
MWRAASGMLSGVLPRVEADLRIGCQMHALHRDDAGVPRHVVRQHQDRRLAIAHKIAAHGVHGVGAGALDNAPERGPRDHAYHRSGLARPVRQLPNRLRAAAVLKTPTVGDGQHDQDLIWAGRVGHRDRYRVKMRE